METPATYSAEKKPRRPRNAFRIKKGPFNIRIEFHGDSTEATFIGHRDPKFKEPYSVLVGINAIVVRNKKDKYSRREAIKFVTEKLLNKMYKFHARMIQHYLTVSMRSYALANKDLFEMQHILWEESY